MEDAEAAGGDGRVGADDLLLRRRRRHSRPHHALFQARPQQRSTTTAHPPTLPPPQILAYLLSMSKIEYEVVTYPSDVDWEVRDKTAKDPCVCFRSIGFALSLRTSNVCEWQDGSTTGPSTHSPQSTPSSKNAPSASPSPIPPLRTPSAPVSVEAIVGWRSAIRDKATSDDTLQSPSSRPRLLQRHLAYHRRHYPPYSPLSRSVLPPGPSQEKKESAAKYFPIMSLVTLIVRLLSENLKSEAFWIVLQVVCDQLESVPSKWSLVRLFRFHHFHHTSTSEDGNRAAPHGLDLGSFGMFLLKLYEGGLLASLLMQSDVVPFRTVYDLAGRPCVHPLAPLSSTRAACSRPSSCRATSSPSAPSTTWLVGLVSTLSHPSPLRGRPARVPPHAERRGPFRTVYDLAGRPCVHPLAPLSSTRAACLRPSSCRATSSPSAPSTTWLVGLVSTLSHPSPLRGRPARVPPHAERRRPLPHRLRPGW